MEPANTNLTWHVISYEGRYLKLKIEFENKLNISSNSEQKDTLRIDILDEYLFRAQDKSFISEKSMIMKK